MSFKVVTGSVLSIVVAQGYFIALSTIVVPQYGSGFFGVLYATDLTARILTVALVGAVIDRCPVRVMVVISDAGRLIGFMLLAALSTQVAVQAPLVTAVVFIATCSSLAPSSMQRIITHTVPQGEARHRALASWRIIGEVSGVLGPMLSAMLLPTIGASNALWVCAFISVAALIFNVIFIPHTPGSADQHPSMLREALQGYRLVWSIVPVRTLVLLDVVHVLFPVAFWMFLIQNPQLVGLSPGQQGWILGVFSLGGIAGAFWARAHIPKRLLSAIIVCQLFFAVPLLGLGFASSIGLVPMCFAAFVGGFGNEASSSWTSMLIADKAPQEAIGRVFSVYVLASLGGMPMGLLLVTEAVKHVPVLPILTVGALVLLGSSVPVLLALALKPRAGVHSDTTATIDVDELLGDSSS